MVSRASDEQDRIQTTASATRLQSAVSTVRGNRTLGWPLIIYLFAVLLPIQFDIGALTISGVRLFLLIAILPLLFNLVLGNYGRILLTDILFFLHVIWIFVSLLVNNPDRAIQFGGSVGIEFFGGYLLARAYVRNGKTFSALFRVVTYLTVISLPFAIYETLTGTPIIIESIRELGLQTGGNVSQEKRLGLERVQVFFLHPIHYGLFSTVAFSMAFVGLKHELSLGWRYVLSFLVALCVFFSLSSGAYLAILLQLSLIFWGWLFRYFRFRWIALTCFLILCYIILDSLSNRTPFQLFMSYATFSPHNAYYRLITFDAGMVSVWKHPMFGLGLNEWVDRPWWMHSSSVDNFWLLMAMLYGIPGFAFLAAGYGIALWRIGRSKLGETPALHDMRRAWMFTFLGLTFTLATVHVWASLYSFVFFIFGAGMWMVSYSEGATSKMQRTLVRYTRFPRILPQDANDLLLAEP